MPKGPRPGKSTVRWRGGYFPEEERYELASDLWAYGEDALAPRALVLSDEDLQLIGEMAFQNMLVPDKPSGAGMMVAKAEALAVVEFVEGRKRPLARKRRRPLKDNPYRRRLRAV